MRYPVKNTIKFLVILACLASCNKKDPNVMEPVSPPVTEGLLKIDSFTPKTGPKGTIVTISGSGFSTKASDNLVTFNGIPVIVISATTSSLKIAIPQVVFGKITIRTANSTITSVDDFLYTYTSSTLAGAGIYGFLDGAAETAQFKDAYGLVVDISGNVYVADGSNNRIRKITPTGVVSTFAGSGVIGFADGAGSVAQFNYPHGIAIDVHGNLYVADAGNNRIRKISPNGLVSTLAGSGEAGFADGVGLAAKFNFPMDVVIDLNGNVIASDGSNGCIRKITSAGLVTTIGDKATLRVPEGIDMDAAGNLYIADTGGNKIFKMNQAGMFTLIAGADLGYLDGPGASAQFKHPEGLAVDYSGNIYVGDLGNAVIRKITPDRTVSTVSGSTRGFVEGIGFAAQFSEPTGIDVDVLGNLYIADTGNSRIRKLQ